MPFQEAVSLPQEELKARYNSMQFIHLRIHGIWQKVRLLRVAGKYREWNVELDSMWLELYEDVKDTDEKAFDKINDKINEVGFHKHSETGKYSKPGELYNAIFKKEQFLRKLQNKQGKATDYKTNDDDWE